MLKQILDVVPEQLTFQTIEKLVEENQIEHQHLDFKRERQPGKIDFPKSVAAMANGGGGIIIVGIEDKEDRAESIVPIELAGEESRTQQQLGRKITPFIRPEYYPVRSPDDPDVGVMVIEIASSELAPYAVRIGARDSGQLGYWIRDGQHTYGLGETRIGLMYRERFERYERLSDRLHQLQREGEERWRDGGLAYPLPRLFLAIIPVSPPPTKLFRPDRPTLKELGLSQNWPPKSMFTAVSALGDNAHPGFKKVIFTTSSLAVDREKMDRDGWIEFRDDGSFLAVYPSSPRSDKSAYDRLFRPIELTRKVVTFLTAAYALLHKYGITGDIVLRTGITYRGGQLHIEPTDPEDAEDYGYHRLFEAVTVDLNLNISDLKPGLDLMQTAKPILDDLFNAFGWPECFPITDGGAIRMISIPGEYGNGAKQWAKSLDIEIVGGM